MKEEIKLKLLCLVNLKRKKVLKEIKKTKKERKNDLNMIFLIDFFWFCFYYFVYACNWTSIAFIWYSRYKSAWIHFAVWKFELLKRFFSCLQFLECKMPSLIFSRNRYITPRRGITESSEFWNWILYNISCVRHVLNTVHWTEFDFYILNFFNPKLSFNLIS